MMRSPTNTIQLAGVRAMGEVYWGQSGSRATTGGRTCGSVIFTRNRLRWILLQAQQDTSPVTLTDYWNGALVPKLVWLQADRQYLTTVATNQWYRLQFQAWEV